MTERVGVGINDRVELIALDVLCTLDDVILIVPVDLHIRPLHPLLHWHVQEG